VGRFDVVGRPNLEIIYSTFDHNEILAVRRRLERIRDAALRHSQGMAPPRLPREDAEFIADRGISPRNLHKIQAFFIRILSTS